MVLLTFIPIWDILFIEVILMPMQFGEILQQLMDENKLTPRQLAKALRISLVMLNNFTRCADEPDFNLLKRMAAYFHVSTDYLVGYDGEA